MSNLDQDTTLIVTDKPNQFKAILSERWKIWGPNGGYLSAISLRAASHFAEGMIPVSLYTQFLRVAAFAEVDLTITVLKKGRSVINIEVLMVQNGKDIIRTTIILAKEKSAMVHDYVSIPKEISSLNDLSLFVRDEAKNPYWDNFNIKFLNSETQKFGDKPVAKAWFEFKGEVSYQDVFLDYARSVILIDTMLWPAAHNIYGSDLGYVAPSLDLFVKFHRPAPQETWLFCDAESALADRGLLSGAASIFDKNSRLLASGGSQMLCQKLPD